jgi:hypothetical protein
VSGVTISRALSLLDRLCFYLLRTSLKCHFCASLEVCAEKSNYDDAATEPSVEAWPAEERNEPERGKLDVIEGTVTKLSDEQQQEEENRDGRDRNTHPPIGGGSVGLRRHLTRIR